LAHLLRVGINQAGRQNRAGRAHGLALHFGPGDQRRWRIPDTPELVSRAVGPRAIGVVKLYSSRAEIAREVGGRGNLRQVGVAPVDSRSLVTSEKECSIATVILGQDNGPPDVGAKLVLMK